MASTSNNSSSLPANPVSANGSVAKNSCAVSEPSFTSPKAHIVEEFTAQLHRAHDLFAGLRDLPTYASPSVWRPYFQRSFSTFTRLWKFQQLHRVVLERDEACGLKRHEIGEIASKIGQLYYHYYLRTSDTGYLLEAFQFYEAIWDRKYFENIMETRLPSVASKRLRYCARFMIVCLLLSRWDRVQVLVVETKKFVDQFAEVLDPLDKEGWRKVYGDMATFVDVLSRAGCTDSIADRPPPNLRLPALDPTLHNKSRCIIGQAIICCCWSNQAKFSDLSIDMYRMQHVLERDPIKCNLEEVKDPNCAQKYLLYMPSVPTILAHLSCSLKDLDQGQVLMFYFTGPGSSASNSTGTSSLSPGTTIDIVQCGLDVKMPAISPTKSTHNMFDVDHEDRLHVTDLLPFMRSPFVAIIDSPAAHTFRKVPRIYSAPFLLLLSPQDHPFEHLGQRETRQSGSLFTSFLAHPIVAIVELCNLGPIDNETWNKANNELNRWESRLVNVLMNHEQSPPFIVNLAKDEFMRRLLARFAISRIVLTHHVHFLKTTELPCCHPDLSDVLWTEVEVISRDGLSQLLHILKCQSLFR